MVFNHQKTTKTRAPLLEQWVFGGFYAFKSVKLAPHNQVLQF